MRMNFLMARSDGYTPEMLQKLSDLGFEIRFLDGPEEQRYDIDFSDIDAVMCYLFFNYNDIRRFTSLKYIHTTSAGLDHMPMDYIREHGIKLCNAHDVYSVPMAEFALGGVLQLYKDAPRFRRLQNEHTWCKEGRLRELGGKKVCIIGAGSIGTETARRFAAMGCIVTGLCRHPAPKPPYDAVVHIDRLDEVLREADIVISSVPLTDETRYLLNAARFACMKDGAVLVNMSRGPVVDTAALIGAMNSGKLSGAVIDVFEEEPLPPESPLWDIENLIVTPHYSFNGENNTQRLFDLLYADTKAWVESLR